MQPDTLAVIAIVAMLAVAALILGLLLNARRSAALRDHVEQRSSERDPGAKRRDPPDRQRR